MCSSLFGPSFSFESFILAAERAGFDDHIVANNRNIIPVSNDALSCSKKDHQRTWRSFTKAIEKGFSQRKIDEICARYKYQWEDLKGASFPLEKCNVEHFGIGASSVTTRDMSEVLKKKSWLPWRRLGSQSVGEMHRLYTEASKLSFLGNAEDPREISGGPRDAHESFVVDYPKMDQQRSNLFIGVEDLLSEDPNIPERHPYYSRLGMGIISLLESAEGKKDTDTVIPAPALSKGQVDYYKVYDIISSGGLTVVALVPLSKDSYLQPILSFRCTKQGLNQTDAIPSILNDFEKNMGESGYEVTKKALAKLMEDRNFTRGKKIKVLAYSLGGGHAGYFMRDHFARVDEFIGFNFIGNDASVIEKLADEINALPDYVVPPSFYIHRNISDPEGKKGDWVNMIGKKHLGWGVKHPNSRVCVYEWIIDDYPAPEPNIKDPTQLIPWLNLHAVRPLDSKREYEYNFYRGSTLCDPILDTYHREGCLEDARQTFGYHVGVAFSAIFSCLNFIFRVLGIEFFRENLRPR